MLKRIVMKRIFVVLFLTTLSALHGETPKVPTLKSILLEQLRSTHNREEWFVPVNIAVEGVTAEQAKWKDNNGDHSIGQLANHLLFWNARQLAKFKEEKAAPFSGDNNETFNAFDAKNWAATVQNLDAVLTEMEKLVENADEAQLNKWASAVAHVAAHH